MVAIGLATVAKEVTQITYVTSTLCALGRCDFNLDTSLVPVT